MRELELAEQVKKKEKKSRKLSKTSMFILYSSLIVLMLFAFLTRNHVIVFIFFTLISFLFNLHTNMITFRTDFGQEVFLGLLLTYAYDMWYGLGLVFVSEFLSDIFTGRMDKNEVLSFIGTIIIIFIMQMLKNFSFMLLAFILITAKFIVLLILDFVLDSDPDEMIMETGLNFVANIILLTAFGDILAGLLLP